MRRLRRTITKGRAEEVGWGEGRGGRLFWEDEVRRYRRERDKGRQGKLERLPSFSPSLSLRKAAERETELWGAERPPRYSSYQPHSCPRHPHPASAAPRSGRAQLGPRPVASPPRCRCSPLRPVPAAAAPRCGRAPLRPHPAAAAHDCGPGKVVECGPAGEEGAPAASGRPRDSDLSDTATEQARHCTGDRFAVPPRYNEIGPRDSEKRRFSLSRTLVSLYLGRDCKTKNLIFPNWNNGKPV